MGPIGSDLRVATPADIPSLRRLIVRSARALSVGYYSPVQIDALVARLFGVDSQLIADGTYYLVDGPASPIAAGGWSARRTLHGGDQAAERDDAWLNPEHEPARLRAFFVHPDWARRGLARRLYSECSRAAWNAGFRRLELMATLPGEPLYLALGFSVVERVEITLPGNVAVPCARMTRSLDAPSSQQLLDPDR